MSPVIRHLPAAVSASVSRSSTHSLLYAFAATDIRNGGKFEGVIAF